MAFSFYLEFIRLSITSVWFLDLDRIRYIVHVLWTPLFVARLRCHVKIYSYIKKSAYQDDCFVFLFFFFSIRLEQQSGLIFFSRMHFARVLSPPQGFGPEEAL